MCLYVLYIKYTALACRQVCGTYTYIVCANSVFCLRADEEHSKYANTHTHTHTQTLSRLHDTHSHTRPLHAHAYTLRLRQRILVQRTVAVWVQTIAKLMQTIPISRTPEYYQLQEMYVSCLYVLAHTHAHTHVRQTNTPACTSMCVVTHVFLCVVTNTHTVCR